MYNLAIRKCTSPPLLAPRLKIFKLKFTTPLGIESRTCWTRGRHATIWANAVSFKIWDIRCKVLTKYRHIKNVLHHLGSKTYWTFTYKWNRDRQKQHFSSLHCSWKPKIASYTIQLLAALAQMVACLTLVQQVRGSIPGGVVNYNLKIFNLGARRGGDVHFLIARLYITFPY